MLKIYVTTDFCKGCKHLLSSNQHDNVNSLRTVLILLANDRDIPKKYKDHQLTNSPYRELHISGDVLLLYRRDIDSDTLVVSLKLSDITNHKGLRQKSSKDNHEYFEVSTEDLHKITSSISYSSDLSDLDHEFINDFVESLSDYASMNMHNGYVLLSDYYFDSSTLHCLYDYYLYSNDNDPSDSIDFVIDLSKYAKTGLYTLQSYLNMFADNIKNSFE